MKRRKPDRRRLVKVQTIDRTRIDAYFQDQRMRVRDDFGNHLAGGKHAATGGWAVQTVLFVFASFWQRRHRGIITLSDQPRVLRLELDEARIQDLEPHPRRW